MPRTLCRAALCAAALAALLIWSPQAAEGVRSGLAACGEAIIPSLFPFFVLSSALSELGAPQRLGRALAPLMRVFGVSGCASTAMCMGLLGGYPLGAASAADLAGRGLISRDEAGRLLGFCNNSGPAFLVGAAGVGVFGSAEAGMALYVCHALAALCTGLLLRGGGGPSLPAPPAAEPAPGAFARAVTASVGNMLKVCGFVVIFSALCGVLDASGLFVRLYGALAARCGLELGAARALLTGFFELGGGISALRGCSPTRASFTIAALMTGWGGVSVHMQTAAAAAGLGLKRHLAGRVISAALSALFAYFASPLVLA